MPCDETPAPCDIGLASCDVALASCDIALASCDIALALCDMGLAPCDMAVASRYIALAPCDMALGLRKIAPARLFTASLKLQSLDALEELAVRAEGGADVGFDQQRDVHDAIFVQVQQLVAQAARGA